MRARVPPLARGTRRGILERRPPPTAPSSAQSPAGPLRHCKARPRFGWAVGDARSGRVYGATSGVLCRGIVCQEPYAATWIYTAAQHGLLRCNMIYCVCCKHVYNVCCCNTVAYLRSVYSIMSHSCRRRHCARTPQSVPQHVRVRLCLQSNGHNACTRYYTCLYRMIVPRVTSPCATSPCAEPVREYPVSTP